MGDDMYKNPHQRDKQNLLKALKTWLKRGKMFIKKWNFSGKMPIIGVENNVNRNQTRKAKWCKIQVNCLKMDRKRIRQD